MGYFIKKIAQFILITTALIFVFEIICRIIGIPKISYHNIAAKAQSLLPKIDDNTVVFLGDSRIEWGIKAHLVENDQGNVINLAFPVSNGNDILRFFLKNKIYPNTIVLGYTPNYYLWTNHNLDNIELSFRNRTEQSFKYFLKQNSYLYDYESIKSYIRGRAPYYINHVYDQWGNAEVEEAGNYFERSKVQTISYKNINNSFDIKKFENYKIELDSLISKFKGKSRIYGIYMPVANNLFVLENEYYDITEVRKCYDYYLDFSQSYIEIDSLCFYDGSHLNREYAIDFSKKVNKIIKTQTNSQNLEKCN